MSDSPIQAPANIVIPIYRTALTDDERIALAVSYTHLDVYKRQEQEVVPLRFAESYGTCNHMG